jgi:hypothetical protein
LNIFYLLSWQLHLALTSVGNATLFPEWIIKQYNLCQHALHGFVHLKMRQAVWGLPHAGILANKQLHCKLAPLGYYEITNIPGL